MADADPADRLYYRETMGLSVLSAAELTARLREHVNGGLVLPTDAEVARECVRRARQAEAAELAALELLDELRVLIGLPELPDVVLDGGVIRTVRPGWRPKYP